MIKKKNKSCSQPSGSQKNRDGLALLFTMVVLVVLSTVAYTLSARLATFRKQQQYMIDYQQSRYACDSAMKYALTTVKDIPLSLATRKDSPDFSDLFTLNHDEYQQMLTDWAILKAEEEAMDLEDSEFGLGDETTDSTTTPPIDMFGPENETTGMTDPASPTDPNNMNDFGVFDMELDIMDPNEIEIPGPYGVDWPLVQEPMEFEIGNSRIIVTIEDENAKMPLTWAMTKNAAVTRMAKTAFETFCEWMQMDSFEIEDLYTQVEDIGTHKQFTINPKPVTYTEKTTVKTTPRRTSRTSRTTSRTSRSTTSTRLTKKTRPAIAHTTDFAKLLHSSMLDTEKLAWALPDTGKRYESPLKYIALWGSQRVNINTAPRHVLEAAFTFGGDAREIAHEIILLRKEKPIRDIDELKTKLYGFNDSIRKTEPYICTRSKFFSVKVTAITGSTKASSVATVIREGKSVQRIAILAN